MNCFIVDMNKSACPNRKHIVLGIALGLLAACSAGLDNPLTPTGSHSIAFDADYDTLAVVNTDAGTVTFIDERSHTTKEVWVGEEPTRIARARGRYFVTLRAERSVAVLAKRDGAWALETKLKVGTEPYGIVATEHGSRVFVAASTEGAVVEISPSSLKVVQKWIVGEEVRWLALRPQNDSLYAVHAFGDRITHINLNNNRVRSFTLPRDPFLTTRFTGDPAFTADGAFLILPTLMVDNQSAVDSSMSDSSLAELPLDELEDHAPAEEDEFFAPSGGYDSGRFIGGLMEVEVDEDDGEPSGEDDGTHFIPIDSSDDGGVVNGYPTSASVSPSGGFYIATVEATHAVVAVSADRSAEEPGFFDIVSGGSSDGFGGLPIAFRPSSVVARVEGARGALFFEERGLAIDGFLGRGVRFQDIRALHLPKPSQDAFGIFGVEEDFIDESEIVVLPLVSATQHRLEPEVERGRKLFFSGANPQMSSSFSGVSCATCHSEGRNDGLTWNFMDGLRARQTLSLAGRISEKGRVTWTASVPSVAHEAMLTSQGRMGGRGLSASDAIDIAAYIDWSRDADYPLKGAPITGRLAEGQALFFSPETGCAGCHSGEGYGSDSTFGVLGAMPTKAVSLRGVAVTPPYMHDGSSPTLRDVLVRCRSGFMGDTSALQPEELEALELYLRSL